MRGALALLLVSVAQPALAALAHPVSVEALAREADAVVQGQVEKRESRWTADGRHIETLVTLRTGRVWKGAIPERIVVEVPGGQVGEIAQRVDAVATFQDGEEVVVFLARAGADRWQVHGLGLGKFRVAGGRAHPSLEGISFTEGQVPAGERRVGTMSVRELERRVKAAVRRARPTP